MDIMLALFQFPVPCDDVLQQCAKKLRKCDFEAAFGRFIIKTQHSLILDSTYEYVQPDAYLALSIKNFFESLTVGDEAEQRLRYFATEFQKKNPKSSVFEESREFFLQNLTP